MVIGTLELPYLLLDGSSYVSRAATPEGGRSFGGFGGSRRGKELKLGVSIFLCPKRGPVKKNQNFLAKIKIWPLYLVWNGHGEK